LTSLTEILQTINDSEFDSATEIPLLSLLLAFAYPAYFSSNTPSQASWF